jgi:hypothetical protein
MDACGAPVMDSHEPGLVASTLNVRDFEMVIVDVDFAPKEAPGVIARLLLQRNGDAASKTTTR